MDNSKESADELVAKLLEKSIMEDKLKKTAAISTPGLRQDQLMEEYQKWQTSDLPYDKVLEMRGYTGPKVTAEALVSVVDPDTRGDLRILDVGAGTGLVAEELKKLGFKNIDALEPSPDMIMDAKEKKLYMNFYKQFLTTDPLLIPDNSYDAVVTCGSFMENHIPLESIRELVRIVTAGGTIIITTRYKHLHTVVAYKDKMEPYLKELQAEGLWKQEERIVFPKYYMEDDGIVWRYTVL